MPDFDFGDDIRKNYLKVVTNIYYLNIRRVQISFREDYTDKGFVFRENRHINQVMNELYSKHLKETRSEVSKFFNLKENADLDTQRVYIRGHKAPPNVEAFLPEFPQPYT